MNRYKIIKIKNKFYTSFNISAILFSKSLLPPPEKEFILFV
jgi:hypothetical protein